MLDNEASGQHFEGRRLQQHWVRDIEYEFSTAYTMTVCLTIHDVLYSHNDVRNLLKHVLLAYCSCSASDKNV